MHKLKYRRDQQHSLSIWHWSKTHGRGGYIICLRLSLTLYMSVRHTIMPVCVCVCVSVSVATSVCPIFPPFPINTADRGLHKGENGTDWVSKSIYWKFEFFWPTTLAFSLNLMRSVHPQNLHNRPERSLTSWLIIMPSSKHREQIDKNKNKNH